jgi:hypothetical protein
MAFIPQEVEIMKAYKTFMNALAQNTVANSDI